MKRFDYYKVVDKVIIDPMLERHTGCYALVYENKQPYYIGIFGHIHGQWNKTNTRCYTLKDRILKYDQKGNGYSQWVWFDRGHVWMFIRTLNQVLDNDIYFNYYEGRKMYFSDYWHDGNGTLRNDHSINWTQTLVMFNEMVTRGKLEAVLLSNDSSYEREQALVSTYNPLCNKEHALDKNQKAILNEESRIKLFEIMRKYGNIREPIEIK
jgi:hypothetical protein